MTYTSHAITLHTRHVPTVLAALRFKREHADAVLKFSDKPCNPRPMTEADRARQQMEVDALDEAIAAIEAAR